MCDARHDLDPAPSNPVPTAFIGCDVGKASVVIFNSQTGQRSTVPNRLEDLQRFTATLEERCLIVCESTGGYEAPLLQAALTTGHAAHRADARKSRRSSAPTARSPRPTPWTPALWRNTARNAMPSSCAGRRPTPTATTCRRWSSPAATS